MKSSVDTVADILVAFILCVFIFRASITAIRRIKIEKKFQKEKDQFKDKYKVSDSILVNARTSFYDPEIKAEVKEIEQELIELTDGIKPSDAMLNAAYYATKGQLTCHETDNMYDFMHIFSYKHLDFWAGFPAVRYEREGVISRPREKYDAAYLKFLKWYDQTLWENGMEYSLMCIEHPREPSKSDPSKSYRYCYKDRKEISQCEDIHEAVCFWEPVVKCQVMKLGWVEIMTKPRKPRYYYKKDEITGLNDELVDQTIEGILNILCIFVIIAATVIGVICMKNLP